ncbi:serine/threonine-protein kinase [Nocardia huaxiensis]|uniref:serine/threonine-protein kinase n=1 Tax=Nocardia huaxiensis TaxID=2755382 RepID=UPI001E589FA9|nr:serine/threonine-protein kinase [Nocardia huaxiensis]UFS95979.1 serine/threonine protein kinase [Nocardia huaxiensis]
MEGRVFAGYRIEHRLGSGGMAVVYRAQHPRLPRKEALKILLANHSEDPDFQFRFLREAEVAARLDHPNLVSVHDRGIHQGRPWIAMQFIDGTDVATLIRHGPRALPPERAVHILGEAARGLDEIHRAGLVHRDVKPANIMVTRGRDGRDRVLVTDFGIARTTEDGDRITGSGAVVGTLGYIAPEQLENGPVDHRADVYALGCTLYQMLTGALPFERGDPRSVVRAHLLDPPPQPSRAGLPAGFDAVIARAMAKDPRRRHPSCGALAEEAAGVLRGDPLGAASGRRLGIRVGATTLVIALAVALALLVRPDTRVVTGNPVAGLTTGAPTTTVSADDFPEWKSYAYIVAAFPSLLPERPDTIEIGSGNCFPTDTGGTSVPVDKEAKPVAQIFCTGAAPPADTTAFTCMADRTPMPFIEQAGYTGEGNQDWTRASGSGRLYWGHAEITPGRVRGVLQVYFESPSRYFCMVMVTGGSTGNELLQRWWPSAPL